MLQQDNYHFLQHSNTAPSSGDKEVIITKLITKVSEQALELTDLTTQLERSAATAISQSSSSSSSSVTNGVYYDLDNLDLHSKHSNRPSPSESSGHSARRGHALDPILSDRNSSSYGGVLHYDYTSSGSSSKQPFHSLSFSEAATQRKHDQETHQQLLSLQMQLEASEGRLTEAVKARKKMINELETKSRELRFYAKKCKELESENNLLRAQNESILKMQSMSALKSSERKGARGHLLKAVDPVVYYKACDDLSFHKKLVEELQVEIEQLREGEQRSVTRTKLLEEALEFRSEEIGLAGHSDLLSKVVKLRNEVNTLKSELSQKHGSAASGAEEEEEKVKADTKQQHEVLQRQILQIQARLSKSQQELYTLQHADVHELLRRAEHERDTLLDFVSSDMQKSSDLSQQVDGLQAQIRSSRLNEKTLEVNNERLTKLLSEDKHRSSEVEDRCHTLSVQLQDLSRSHRILEVEKEQLSKQLELKRLEAEEVGKVSSNLYAQSKSKDSELISLANEVTVLTTQLVEYRIVVPRLEEDNKQLRDRCRSSDSEAQLLRESLGVFESKLHRLEPELKLLRSERESMLQEKYSLETEATKLRPLGRILVEMSRDIAQVNEMFSLPSQVSAAARSDRNNNTLHPNKSSSEVEVGDREEDIAALPSSEGGEEESLLQSQKHTLWVGLPSIRALHGGLYENIRRLARDLQEKELQLNETVGKYTSLQKEYHKAKADNEHMHQQLSTLQRESSQVIHQLTESNLKSDKEIVKLRGLAEIVDQIRSSIVNSYPSSIMQLYSRDSIDMGNLTNLPTYEMKTAESSPFSSRNALSPEHWKASNREYLAKEIHDRSLSDLVGKIITYSTASVVDFEASQSTISELQRTVRGLQLQCDELSRYKQDSLQGASAMNSLVHRADERCVLLEKECAEKVAAAVDLAEKQNALTMSLEAKVEKLQRDKKVTAAQLTAMHQKESSIRHKLLLALQDYCGKVGIDSPPDSCQIVDLLHYASDILRRMAMQQLSFPSTYSPSATIMPLSRPSFAAHHQQSSSEAQSVEQPDFAASRWGSSSGAATYSQPPSSRGVMGTHGPRHATPLNNLLPADSSSYRNNNLLGSTSGRFSSPAPRAESAARQQSRGYQLDPTPISSSEQTGNRSSASSPYKTRATSRNPISSALQDRLYQAQQAFAAMKEAHHSGQ